jgi:hypothetical protein
MAGVTVVRELEGRLGRARFLAQSPSLCIHHNALPRAPSNENNPLLAFMPNPF